MKYIFNIFINIYTYPINRINYTSIFEYWNNDDIGRVRDSGN